MNPTQKNDIGVLDQVFKESDREMIQVVYQTYGYNFSNTYKALKSMGCASSPYAADSRVILEENTLQVSSLLPNVDEATIRNVLLSNNNNIENSFGELYKYQQAALDTQKEDEINRAKSLATLKSKFPQIPTDEIKQKLESLDWDQNAAIEELSRQQLTDQFNKQINVLENQNTWDQFRQDELRKRVDPAASSLTWSTMVKANESVIAKTSDAEDNDIIVDTVKELFKDLNEETIRNVFEASGWVWQTAGSLLESQQFDIMLERIMQTMPVLDRNLVRDYLTCYFPDEEETVKQLQPHFEKHSRLALLEKIMNDSRSYYEDSIGRQSEFENYLSTSSIQTSDQYVLERKRHLEERSSSTELELNRAVAKYNEIKEQYIPGPPERQEVPYYLTLQAKCESAIERRNIERRDVGAVLQGMQGNQSNESPVLSPNESFLFEKLFLEANTSGTGSLSKEEAPGFFLRSGLDTKLLAKIWSQSSNGKAYLDRNAFYNALRLVALAQSGQDPTMENLRRCENLMLPYIGPQLGMPPAPSPSPYGGYPGMGYYGHPGLPGHPGHPGHPGAPSPQAPQVGGIRPAPTPGTYPPVSPYSAYIPPASMTGSTGYF
eukprot:TRINITY_DN2064_c0_g1_i1.p1 TRINITY_DN2064_c0_g1~~TRINITY_DN2064_c0_g1_i1.p1  ORF type:complete len:605 (+),score=170.11 TRINITY_DN2064_c0_g1_i1:42-1856(+)